MHVTVSICYAWRVEVIVKAKNKKKVLTQIVLVTLAFIKVLLLILVCQNVICAILN